jgi:arylformamidase
VQLFIHGGYWRSLDAATFAFLAEAFVPEGAVLVVLDYPLIPEVDLAAIVAACERAVAWTWRHAAEHGGDPERLFVSGNSAGGHLVALLMDRAWPRRHGLPEDVVAGGCAISGLFDLEPVRLSAQNETLSLTARDVATLSPIRRLPRAAGPLILAVGGAETEEFRRQTADYARAWRAAGLACDELVVPGANHIDIVLDHLGRQGSPLHAAVLRQMGLGGA